MWITEIREKETDHVLARVEHGTSYNDARDLIRAYMVRFSATHSVHLFWEEE